MNTRSRASASPKPRLDFPGASAEIVKVSRDGVHFAARLGDSPLSMWWHFAVEGGGGGERQFIWERTNEVLGGGGLARTVPVVRTARGWRRLPAGNCAFDPASHSFRFTVPDCGERVEVAFCFPYGLDRVDWLLTSLQRRPEVTVRTVGESAGGRPFRLVEVGHGDTHVWLAARHHAGEMTGGYVLEGLLQEAVRRPELLARLTIHVAPVMDVDGVAEGMYGKDRAPRDFNRDYATTPCRPEVAAFMAAAAAVGQADVFVDLHGPAPGDGTFVVPIAPTFTTDDEWYALVGVARSLEAFAPVTCPCPLSRLSRSSINWYGDLIFQNSTPYFHQCFGALAFTLETSYHRAWNGRLLTPSGWRGLGRALLDAIAARVGEKKAPPGRGREVLPEPLTPRLRDWHSLSWPALRLRQRRSWLEITGPDPANGAVMTRRILPGDDGVARCAYRLDGAVGGVRVVVKGMDARSGRPTGETESVPVELQAGAGWQPLALPHKLGAHLLIFRVQGLEGTLCLRTGEVC